MLMSGNIAFRLLASYAWSHSLQISTSYGASCSIERTLLVMRTETGVPRHSYVLIGPLQMLVIVPPDAIVTH